MKFTFIFFFFLLIAISDTSLAQHSFSARVIDHENNRPVTGATVYIEALNKGEVTDQNGEVVITGIPTGEYTIRIRFLGYETIIVTKIFPLSYDEQNHTFELHHSHEEYEEILVTSTRSSRTIEDIPTRVEVIAGEELSEKGNMKPGDIRMLLNESTGIQTQQTSATSYNSSIRIQGLDGKYTQLLRDGLPLYSGFSSGLSLMQITPLDLKQVEVIKGASSTLYGGGAISGLVNLISKAPEDEQDLSFMLNTTSALGLDISGFYSSKNKKIGTTVFASYNKGTAYDPADIGLTAIPEFDRFTFNPKLFLYLSDQTSITTGINLIVEDRLGGNIAFIEGESVNDPYFEENQTERISSQFLLTHQFSDKASLTLKNSLNFYDRSVEIPDFLFSGNQTSSFSEANISIVEESTEWIAGINLWTDNFDQTEGSPSSDLSFSDAVVGAFVQNIWNLQSLWTLETGFRIDSHNEYGTFALPRISLMYEPSPLLTFRLGGGLGYKTPTVFTEDTERLQFQNVLPISSENFKAEQSFGGNFDINYQLTFTDELALSTNVLFFYTQIQDPLTLRQDFGSFLFIQQDGFVETKGVEVNMKWSYDHFKLFVGYTYANAENYFEGNTNTLPLVAKHRLNNVLMYEKHGEFWIGLEAYYFSPQTLGDGSQGKSYWITGLMTEKVLNETFSIFLNFENFLDTRQTEFDTIYTGSLSDPEFRDIYAPVDGFVINGGFKIRF
ncbi:MAG: TonB-dependent receptor [Balneolaceae bacterium]